MTKRYILYQKMDEIIMRKPLIPLFYDKVARFTRKKRNGAWYEPLNLLSLKVKE
jgi:peptide/nickel transport system substrate-binding protein